MLHRVLADVSMESVTNLESLCGLVKRESQKANASYVFKPSDMDHCIAIVPADDGKLWVIDPVPRQVGPLTHIVSVV